MRAGIGNLVAEKHPRQVHAFFAEYITARYWLSAVICFCLLQQVTPFISLWLGNEYVLDSVSFYILILSTFLSLANSFESFLSAYGLFQDVFSPVVEGALHLSFSILLGYYWGLPGILAGRVAGLLFLICWKPYFLYRYGFKMSVGIYWKNVLLYLCMFVFSWALTDGILLSLALPKPEEGYLEWSLYALVSSLLFLSILTILFYNFSKGIRTLLGRFIHW